MLSNDIRITINGQDFIVDGRSLKPAPVNSFQQEVLKRLDGIESEQKAIRSEVQNIHDEQLVLKTRVDMLIYGGGIAFTILCAVIAWTSLFAPKLWERMTRKESAPAPAPAPTVITIPQPDIHSLARQVSEILGIEPKRHTS